MPAAGLHGMWQDRRETPFHLPVGAHRFQAGILIVAVGVIAVPALAGIWVILVRLRTGRLGCHPVNDRELP